MEDKHTHRPFSGCYCVTFQMGPASVFLWLPAGLSALYTLALQSNLHVATETEQRISAVETKQYYREVCVCVCLHCLFVLLKTSFITLIITLHTNTCFITVSYCTLPNLVLCA